MPRSLSQRVIRGKLRWAGHVECMDDGRLPKRAMSHVEVGRRERPRLRWKDCVERDFKRAGGVGDWRARARSRGSWRALANDAAVS